MVTKSYERYKYVQTLHTDRHSISFLDPDVPSCFLLVWIKDRNQSSGVLAELCGCRSRSIFPRSNSNRICSPWSSSVDIALVGIKMTTKGACGGECNRTACNNQPATWFNLSTLKHYCRTCARKINDVSNPTETSICVLCPGTEASPCLLTT